MRWLRLWLVGPLLVLVAPASNAAAEPAASSTTETRIDLGVGEVRDLIRLDDGRLLIAADDELQLRSPTGALLMRATDLTGANRVRYLGDSIAVVSLLAGGELVAIDLDDGTEWKRLDTGATVITEIDTVADRVVFAHHDPFTDNGVGFAFMGSEVVDPFFYAEGTRYVSGLRINAARPNDVFVIDSRWASHRLDRSGAEPVQISNHSIVSYGMELADDGSSVWIYDRSQILELDPGSMQPTGSVWSAPVESWDLAGDTTMRQIDDRLLAASEGHHVRVWRLDQPGEPVGSAWFDHPVTSFDFDEHHLYAGVTTPDGAQLVITGYDRQLSESVVPVTMLGYGSPPAERPTIVWQCDASGDAGSFEVAYGHTVYVSVDPSSTICHFRRSDAPTPSLELWLDRNTGDLRVLDEGRSVVDRFAPGSTAEPVVLFDVYPNPLDDTDVFVRTQYDDLLGRAADEGGVAFWSGRIDAGAMSRSEFVQSIVESPEYLGTIAPLSRLYLAYFERAPDDAGLTFWTGQLRAGRSLADISEHFARSAEFERTYGGLDDGEFVELVYRNVLDRAPDVVGQAFWQDRLAAGLPRGTLMLQFSESPENIERTTPQIVVRALYRGLLQREPDRNGADFWTQYYRNSGSLTAMITGFITSDEYAQRFEVFDEPG